ncbi:MAG: hypothetical protein OIF48_02445 [Silicimonas sp.]|nr:hypothetical protein [Silicimonas sp.]
MPEKSLDVPRAAPTDKAELQAASLWMTLNRTIARPPQYPRAPVAQRDEDEEDLWDNVPV